MKRQIGWRAVVCAPLFCWLLVPSTLQGASDNLQLVMLEQALCEWCEAWDHEIAPVYPKTWEGQLAPLRRVDIHDDRPADIKDFQWGRFTPTFILIKGDMELGRIVGYPGEDFFWALLAEMLAKAGYSKERFIESRSDQ